MTDREFLEASIMAFLSTKFVPYSASEVARALRTDYRQTLAALHRLNRAGRLGRTFFHGANLSAYWIPGNVGRVT